MHVFAGFVLRSDSLLFFPITAISSIIIYIMMAQKLSAEPSSQTSIRKQRSQIINAKYLLSSEFTSVSGQLSTSLQHFTTISIRSCQEELNAHLAENRPLKPAYVMQIKKYLSQIKMAQEGFGLRAEENRRASKEPKSELKFMNKSPYIINYNLKKAKSGLLQLDAPQMRRRTLKKRKINAQNMEFEKVNKPRNKSEQRCNITMEIGSQLKEQINKMRGQILQIRKSFISQIEQLRDFMMEGMQKMNDIATNNLQISLSTAKEEFRKKENTLQQSISILEKRMEVGRQKETVLKQYLNQRETELMTALAAFNMRTH